MPDNVIHIELCALIMEKMEERAPLILLGRRPSDTRPDEYIWSPPTAKDFGRRMYTDALALELRRVLNVNTAKLGRSVPSHSSVTVQGDALIYRHFMQVHPATGFGGQERLWRSIIPIAHREPPYTSWSWWATDDLPCDMLYGLAPAIRFFAKTAYDRDVAISGTTEGEFPPLTVSNSYTLSPAAAAASSPPTLSSVLVTTLDAMEYIPVSLDLNSLVVQSFGGDPLDVEATTLEHDHDVGLDPGEPGVPHL